jgi:hypothetical protein
MPASLANQIMACYWMENGIEIEPISKIYHDQEQADKLRERFNTPKSWDYQLL